MGSGTEGTCPRSPRRRAATLRAEKGCSATTPGLRCSLPHAPHTPASIKTFALPLPFATPWHPPAPTPQHPGRPPEHPLGARWQQAGGTALIPAGDTRRGCAGQSSAHSSLTAAGARHQAPRTPTPRARRVWDRRLRTEPRNRAGDTGTGTRDRDGAGTGAGQGKAAGPGALGPGAAARSRSRSRPKRGGAGGVREGRPRPLPAPGPPRLPAVPAELSPRSGGRREPDRHHPPPPRRLPERAPPAPPRLRGPGPPPLLFLL